MTESRSKCPAFQWYPGDHRRDTAVQACTFEARALWRELLDLMHDGEPYGHLSAGGVAIDAMQLARMVGVPASKASAWLKELEDRRVFSRTDAGVIYSRRMVKDDRVRRARAAGGAKSLTNPNVPRPKRSKGPREGYPSDDPSGLSFPESFDGSPAVCSLQSASAVPKTLAADAAPVLGKIDGGLSQTEKRKTWLAPYADAWKAEMGGEMASGIAATVFKELEASHDRETIVANFRRYCREHRGARSMYAALPKFAQTFAQWGPQVADAPKSSRTPNTRSPAQQEQHDHYARLLEQAMREPERPVIAESERKALRA